MDRHVRRGRAARAAGFHRPASGRAARSARVLSDSRFQRRRQRPVHQSSMRAALRRAGRIAAATDRDRRRWRTVRIRQYFVAKRSADTDGRQLQYPVVVVLFAAGRYRRTARHDRLADQGATASDRARGRPGVPRPAAHAARPRSEPGPRASARQQVLPQLAFRRVARAGVAIGTGARARRVHSRRSRVLEQLSVCPKAVARYVDGRIAPVARRHGARTVRGLSDRRRAGRRGRCDPARRRAVENAVRRYALRPRQYVQIVDGP